MALDLLENTSTWTAFIRSLALAPATMGDASYALHVRGSLEAYVAFRNQLVGSVTLFWQDVFDGRIEDYNATGRMAIAACEAARRTAVDLRKKLSEASQRGIPADFAENFAAVVKEFEQADAQLGELLQTLDTRWPWVKADWYSESAATVHPGRARPAREVFDELRRRVS